MRVLIGTKPTLDCLPLTVATARTGWRPAARRPCTGNTDSHRRMRRRERAHRRIGFQTRRQIQSDAEGRAATTPPNERTRASCDRTACSRARTRLRAASTARSRESSRSDDALRRAPDPRSDRRSDRSAPRHRHVRNPHRRLDAGALQSILARRSSRSTAAGTCRRCAGA